MFQVESFILDQDDQDEPVYDTSKFLLAGEGMEGADLRNVDPETQERLEALLEAAGACSQTLPLSFKLNSVPLTISLVTTSTRLR